MKWAVLLPTGGFEVASSGKRTAPRWERTFYWIAPALWAKDSVLQTTSPCGKGEMFADTLNETAQKPACRQSVSLLRRCVRHHLPCAVCAFMLRGETTSRDPNAYLGLKSLGSTKFGSLGPRFTCSAPPHLCPAGGHRRLERGVRAAPAHVAGHS